MKLDVDLIQKVLPHRYPFLLVDRVLEMRADYTKALKNVSFNEEFFVGHFPNRPVMPGVLQVEAMAQTACFMAYCDMLKDHDEDWKPNLNVYFTGIEAVRFRKVVVPGDQLIIEVSLTKRKRQFWWMKGLITINGEPACEAEMSAVVQDGDK
jgi:beta-hydroxyacyl-ACP dehydratase FabZ